MATLACAPSGAVFKTKTIRQEAGPGVWTFDQLIGIYYVQVPIRMTVIKMETGGLFVYAPVAPTPECLALLQPLIDAHGSIRYIVLPSVAVEHKVNAGPFARQFPDAEFYVVDRQYSFPVPLPSAFLGLPRWAKPLPPSSSSGAGKGLWGGEFEHEVLTVEPGPASMFQEGAFVHKPSKTLLLCDTLFSATSEPPAILQSEPEYVRALLFHARDAPLELVEDTPEARRKGWRRIVLLFNFFFPGSARVDLGIGPLVESRGFTRPYTYGWGGWQPLKWRGDDSEQKALIPISPTVSRRCIRSCRSSLRAETRARPCAGGWTLFADGSLSVSYPRTWTPRCGSDPSSSPRLLTLHAKVALSIVCVSATRTWPFCVAQRRAFSAFPCTNRCLGPCGGRKPAVCEHRL